MIFWIWCAAVFAALTLYFRQVYSKFSRHGVKHFRPLPLIGNLGNFLLRRTHLVDDMELTYNSFPEERFVGRYDFTIPMIFVRDLDLVKKITVKDFEHFIDHRVFVDQKVDPLFGRNLFALQGQEWKEMRSTLSPAFTSSKIRLMVPFMIEAGENMKKSIMNKILSSEDGYVDIDVKDLTTRYTNDVIASCAFGLKVDSHTERENAFYLKGKEATTMKFKQMVKILSLLIIPKVMKMFKISVGTDSLKSFFRSLVLDTMKDREERNIIRPDMIHLLMEAKKGTLSHTDKEVSDADAGYATVEESAVGKKDIKRDWSDDDLIAQAVIFFVAGFETVSVAMTFLLHELTLNPDVQEKLVQEIRENDARNGGKFDYNSVQRMTYLDMVVSELLRLWPPAVALDRRCEKDYNLGKPNVNATEDYIIRKGEGIGIPVWAFHRNPEYFPEPLKFDPERFSEQNKRNIKPFSYMPFGLGPRNCIGSRFALCEVKVMVYQLLQSLQVSVSAKTQLPPKLALGSFNVMLEGGHWARFTVREQLS